MAAAGDLPTLFARSPLRRLGALPSKQPGDSHSSCSWMTVLAAALPLKDTTCKPCPTQNSHSPSHIFSSLACIAISTGPGQWNSFLQPSHLSEQALSEHMHRQSDSVHGADPQLTSCVVSGSQAALQDRCPLGI